MVVNKWIQVQLRYITLTGHGLIFRQTDMEAPSSSTVYESSRIRYPKGSAMNHCRLPSLANKLSTAHVLGLWSSLAQMRLFLFVWVQKNLQKRSSGPRTSRILRNFRTILGQGRFDQPLNLETEMANPVRASILSWTSPNRADRSWQAEDGATVSWSQGPIPWALWASPSHQRSSTILIELDSPRFHLV